MQKKNGIMYKEISDILSSEKQLCMMPFLIFAEVSSDQFTF